MCLFLCMQQRAASSVFIVSYIPLLLGILDFLLVIVDATVWVNTSLPVIIPDRALVLDWVFADGPPNVAVVYDNNHKQDFHAIFPKSPPEELYWVEEELRMYRELQKERRQRVEAIRAKVRWSRLNSL